MEKLGQVFKTHGLTVTGTPEQIEHYSHDEHAYDYIKGTIEHLIKYSEKYAGNNVTFRYARISNGNKLVIANENKKNINTGSRQMTSIGQNTQLFIYNAKTKTFNDIVSIDELESMKDIGYLEWAKSFLDSPMVNAINKDTEEKLSNRYHEKLENQKQAERDIIYKPMPLDNSKQSLASGKGFYVGDPVLVLKDSILNKGVRLGNKMQTGVYEVEGHRMVISPATNGCHGGHDIYSGTIGVVPLELVDTDKIKRLPSDSLDIRTGNNINMIIKQNKMYLAQSSIDEINIVEQDRAVQTENPQFNI